MSRVIGLISGKGGVGKSTTAINLASALQSLGKTSVVVDGNLDTPNVGVLLGSPVVDFHLHHVLKGKKGIKKAVYLHDSGLEFVPAGLGVMEMKGLNYAKLKRELRKLDHDFVLVDGPAGLGQDVKELVKSCDEFIIVCNAEMTSVTDAMKAAKFVEKAGKNVLGTVVTRVKKDDLDVSYSSVENLLEYPVIGIVPEDDRVRESAALHDSAVSSFPKSNVAKGYLKLGSAFAGVEYVEELSLWEKLVGWIK